MLIALDESSHEPLRAQIAAQVRRAIVRGEVAAGASLPPARTLARELGVNMHTVLGAYQMLRDEGLIDLRRGRGATVRADGLADDRVTGMARDLLAAARASGLSTDEVLSLIRGLS